jgi:cell division septum initiation protein DivIVA
MDELEELVTTGRRVPFSANVVVNEDETLELIDRARLGLPDEVVRARHTILERERILSATATEAHAMVDRAQQDAHAIVAEAEAQAKKMLEGHELLRLAQERADALIAEAEAKADHISREADNYAREVMQDLEEHLGRAHGTVRKGLQALPRRKGR